MKNLTERRVSAQDVRDRIRTRGCRSARERGVKAQALDLIEGHDTLRCHAEELQEQLLNNARDWYQYSWGGSALVYNGDIAERYMTPSELKRYNAPGHDAEMAFGGENLIDMQARALKQAYRVVFQAVHFVERYR
jgi:hypothetical protein